MAGSSWGLPSLGDIYNVSLAIRWLGHTLKRAFPHDIDDYVDTSLKLYDRGGNFFFSGTAVEIENIFCTVNKQHRVVSCKVAAFAQLVLLPIGI